MVFKNNGIAVFLDSNMTVETLQRSYDILGVKALKLMPSNIFNVETRVAFWELPKYYGVLKKAAELNIIFVGEWNIESDPIKWELPEFFWDYAAGAHLIVLHQYIPDLKIYIKNASDLMLEVINLLPDNVLAI